LVLQLETGKINCVRLPRYGRLPLGGACNNARIPNWFARSERGILRVLDQQRSTDRHKELMSDFPLLKRDVKWPRIERRIRMLLSSPRCPRNND
jgi:hypothetical protein